MQTDIAAGGSRAMVIWEMVTGPTGITFGGLPGGSRILNDK